MQKMCYKTTTKLKPRRKAISRVYYYDKSEKYTAIKASLKVQGIQQVMRFAPGDQRHQHHDHLQPDPTGQPAKIFMKTLGPREKDLQL